MTMLIIVTVAVIAPYDFNNERNPIWNAIFGVQESVELDIIDLDLCNITADIVEVNIDIESVFNYTTYNFVNDSGVIRRNFYNVTFNESIFKIPYFPSNMTYTNNFTFNDLGFGEINDTIVPFFEEDYYWYYPSPSDAVINVTFAYVYRPIDDDNIIFNESSVIVGNNILTITKTGWYKVLHSSSQYLNLSLNNISTLFDLVSFPLFEPSIIYLEEDDFITSKNFISTPFDFPNFYLGFESGESDIENLNGCRRLALEYLGT